MFVIAFKAGMDIVAIQQLASLARILASNQVSLFHQPQRPQRNIFEIANRRSDQIEASLPRRARSNRRSSRIAIFKRRYASLAFAARIPSSHKVTGAAV